MKEDLVSIIIPVYNVKQYLDDCMSSVLNQTHTNIEVLLIDDGSTDGSGELCDVYAQTDSRVRVVHQMNKGQAAARNCGIASAKGKYITFVDSDDYIDRTMVDTLLEYFVESGFVMCQKTKVDADGNSISAVQYQKKCDCIRKNVYFRRLRNNPDYIVVWGKLFARHLFQDIRFLEGIQYEDEEIMPQLVHLSKEICIVDKPLYFYRIRENSTMTKPFSKKSLDIITVCEKRIEYYRSWKMRSMFIWAVKDYYLQLVKLSGKAKAAKDEDAVREIEEKLHNWNQYNVKFSPLDRFKYRRILNG